MLIFSTRQIDDIQPLSFDTECNSRMYEMGSGGANIGSGPTNWAFWTRKTKSVKNKSNTIKEEIQNDVKDFDVIAGEYLTSTKPRIKL